MTNTYLLLRIFSITVSFFIFFIVIRMLVKRKLNESNSILWLLIGFVILLAGFLPANIDHLAILIGIHYPPTLVLIMIVFKNSMDISKAEAKINDIASVLSILREENKLLKEMLTEIIEREIEDRVESDDILEY